MRILITMAAFFSLISRMFGGDDKPAYDLAEIYVDMRGQILNIDPEKIGIDKEENIWAILMETGYPEAAATLIAVSDGSASLYFSNGGGIIGAGGHDNVRPASIQMTKMAEGFLNEMDRVESFPTTTPGFTQFYVVTKDGVFTYKAKEDDLGEDRDKLTPLFYQGHELIGQMRIAEGNTK